MNITIEELEKLEPGTFDVIDMRGETEIDNGAIPGSVAIPEQELLENPPVEGDEDYQKLCGLSAALEAPFSEIERYWEYINGNASFDTHQGVKGLEFERVMVIIDEKSSQGTMFNYEKLFGIMPKSPTDLKNESEGKETTLDRTRRLLYVTCSRAIDSLAIVFYTDCVDTTASALSQTSWFSENEIIVI